MTGCPTRPGTSKAAVILTAAFCLGPTLILSAHDPGLSSLTVVVDPAQVSATLSMSPADARLLKAERAASLETLALEAIDVRAGGVRLAGLVTGGTGAAECPSGRGADGRAGGCSSDADVIVHVTFGPASGSSVSVHSKVPGWMPRGHRELLRVQAADGGLLVERMLDAGTGAIAIDLHGGVTGTSAARSFFELGVRHILCGHDHLLFLGALLLAARRVKDVVRTTAAFTAGHSLTLAPAALGLVTAPAALVEPVIALSIVWAGLESLRRPAGSRWMLAGAFGLVHGFGFAGALQDLGIGTSPMAIAMRLGSFNAGVEAGQVTVAALMWPAIRQLHARPVLQSRLAPACAALIAIAGACWFVQRTIW